MDLMQFFVASEIVSVQVRRMGDAWCVEITEDKTAIILRFSDGFFDTIHSYANGENSFPKERVEVFCDDAVLQMDNYRILKGYGWKGFNKMKLMRQDKGQQAFYQCLIFLKRKILIIQ